MPVTTKFVCDWCGKTAEVPSKAPYHYPEGWYEFIDGQRAMPQLEGNGYGYDYERIDLPPEYAYIACCKACSMAQEANSYRRWANKLLDKAHQLSGEK